MDTGNALPIRQPPQRLPLVCREEASQAIKEVSEQGIIEPSDSPWASPMVLVRKKDGGLRFCVDYWKLNQVPRKDSYPLPRINETLEALGGTEWFSTLNLKSGYWQNEMEERARPRSRQAMAYGSFM